MRNTSEPIRLLNVLSFIQRHVPRGKGSIPRHIGKLLSQDGKYYLTTKHGAKLFLSPDSFDVYATMHREQNSWDYEDFRICLDSLPPEHTHGGVFYEIGANVGYFAVEAAHLRAQAKVYAFEPQTSLVSAIKHSIEANSLRNIRIFDALLGDREGESTLYIASASIHASAVPDSGRNPVRTVPKAMLTIDGLVARREIEPPDFVKMDVEGSEALVFKGANATFREYMPNVFLEYLPEFDVENRVRNEVEALISASRRYVLYGIPSMKARVRHTRLFEPIDEIGWENVHGLYLQNLDRAVSDEALFSRPSRRAA